MALVLSYTTTPPTMDTQIYMDTFRDGATIRIVVSAVCTFRYNDGYLNPNYYATLNVWTATDRQSVSILDYGQSWRASQEKSRTRTVSVTMTSTSNNVEVGYNISGASGQHSLVTPNGNNYVTLAAPSYNAPSAPTWFNLTPNPCDINRAPLLTWGGATPGSNGVLTYDVEVQSTAPDGGWTNWLRISNAQTGTSYQEIVLNQMNVNGVRPYVGVQYQYRVRTSDNYAATSGWIYGTLYVSFGNPTSPTAYTLNPERIKVGENVVVSWSGASGGSGSISRYIIQKRVFNHTTQTWNNWAEIGNTTSTSYTYRIPDDLKNEDLVQFRICTINSWGQTSDWLITSSVTIRGNQMWFNVNGVWKESEIYLKINETWKEAEPYIKVDDIWKESV